MNNSAGRWLWKVAGGSRRIILALTVCQMLSGMMSALFAVLLRGMIDDAVSGNTSSFWRGISYVAGWLILNQGLNAMIRWLNELGKGRLENRFRARLTENILLRNYCSISATHSGEWMNRLTNDTGVVAGSMTEILPGLAGMGMKLLSAIYLILVMEPGFALLVLPAGGLILLLSTAFRKKLKMLHRDMQERDGRVRIFLQERIESLLLIRAFSAEKLTMEEAESRMDAHLQSRMRKNRFSNLCNIGFGLGMQGMYLFGICYCAYGILNGSISYGTLTAMMHLLGQIQAPFANISGFIPRYYAMIASAERLMEIEQFEAEPVKLLESWKIEDLYMNRFEALEMRDVCFTYPHREKRDTENAWEGERDVLRDFTLRIQKGEYIAFTGPSGCGKSTVVKLMMCVYRMQTGQYFIQAEDGNRIPMDARYRRLFAYVPQGNQLMSGSIRDVVTWGKGGEEQKIWQALLIACAEEFVSALPEGLDTILGEHGAGLSEGQMQRIAIARALYTDAPILLLDESTSALDEETEERLLRQLRNLTDRTVIIVTHRRRALEICDREVRFS